MGTKFDIEGAERLVNKGGNIHQLGFALADAVGHFRSHEDSNPNPVELQPLDSGGMIRFGAVAGMVELRLANELWWRHRADAAGVVRFRLTKGDLMTFLSLVHK